jgi:Q-cell neuroblast polarisation
LSKISKFKIPVTVLYALVVFAAALGLRLYIVGVVEESSGGWTPFTLESALLFHYAERYAVDGELEEVDYRAQYPEGVEVYKKFSLGKGIIAAKLWKVWPGDVSFARFVRIFDAVVFSTGAIALFLVVLELTGLGLGAFCAALLYAVALPAVQRSTGLEFSRENFSLPFLFFHVYLYSRALNKDSLFIALMAALPVTLAVATWDMSQLYLVLIVIYAAIRILVLPRELKLIGYLVPSIAACAVVGAASPYLRDHHFLSSYAMVAGYSLAIFYILCKSNVICSDKIRRVVLFIFIIAAVAAVPWISGYSKTYSHFGELLSAKFRFFNVKPVDPALLSFDARVMWTPALHSATSKYLGIAYPLRVFIPFFIFGLLPLIQWLTNNLRLEKKKVPEGTHLLFWMSGLFFVLYLIFVRMQVFLIFFLCAVIGLSFMYMRIFRWSRWTRAVWVVLLALLLWSQVIGYSDKSRIVAGMTTGEDYRQLGSLVEWIKENTEPDSVVLADFGLSPVIYHYTGRKIVLQPKFESRDMRLKYREFVESIFDGREREFYDFCLKYDVDYFVFDNGTFTGKRSPGWIYTPWYMSGKSGPIKDTQIYKLSRNRGQLNYFFWFEDFTDSIQYTIFRVATPENIKKARELVRLGDGYLRKYLKTGDEQALTLAEKELVEATHYYPGLKEAYIKLVTVFTARKDLTGAAFAGDRAKALMREEPQ